MRKGIAETTSGTRKFDRRSLHRLRSMGYKFVQVKGFTIDKHYEYIEPHFILLVPLKELPTDPLKKDIYEPIDSEILLLWASEINIHPEILIPSHLNRS